MAILGCRLSAAAKEVANFLNGKKNRTIAVTAPQIADPFAVDDLYEEIYLLKKRIKELEKQLAH